MSKRIQRLGGLIRKEIIQLLRDRRSLLFIIGLPLIELFLFAYAVSLTIYHLPTAIVDQSRDRKSREFIQALVNSQYFDATLELQSQAEAAQAIDRGDVKVGVIIPPGFARQTDMGGANVLILLDGSDSFGVQSGYSAASTVAQNYASQLTAAEVMRTRSVSSAAAASTLPITVSTRILYNPNLVDMWFILPGLIGLILQTLAVQQAAMIVVRERELGTIEQILVTPARPIELLVSKMIPLLLLCLLALGIVVGLGVFWFGVPFQGSVLLYFGLAGLFITSSLGLGLLLSTLTQNQQQAQHLSMLIMMLSMLLSGVIYPRSAMPAVPYFISDLFPATYFVRLSRAVFVKGVGLNLLWSDALVLVIYGVVIIFIAASSFKRRLD